VALSPLNRRRFENFRRNRRGWWSLWIFTFLFVVSLFAEFIANDKPLVVQFDGGWYFPVLKEYAETTFGGEFPTEADYRDPYVQELINAEGWMVWPLIPYGHQTHIRDLKAPAPTPPDARNWLGTDDQGRDVMARMIYGFRISVLFGLTLTLASSVIGVVAGAVQGYFGGWTDLLFQRFIEVWAGLPVLYLLIILASVVEPNFWWLLGLMLLFSWMTLVGVVRAEFLRARNFDYIRAARALGVSDGVIIFRHTLPNAMVATLTFLPFILNGSITTLTSLDFLGFGLPPGSAFLGELLAQGKNNLQAPWIGLTAFPVLPVLYLLIILASVVEPNFWWLLLLMLLFSWMSLVGVVRAEFLRARNFDYIRAARALGVSNTVIMFRHTLPNAMVATLTFLPFILNGSITTLTSLDFLGFGLPPGSPSLGELLAQGKNNLQAPWLGISSFMVLAVMLSLLIFIGEAARDAFDPRKTFR
jgi:microcin C transport system permease protein